MARTKQNARKKKQRSQDVGIQDVSKRQKQQKQEALKRQNQKKQEALKRQKQEKEKQKTRALEAAYKQNNIQNGVIAVVISLSIVCLNRQPRDHLAGYGIVPISGGITPIQGAEVGREAYSYIFELKCIRYLLQACPQGRSVTVITKSNALYNFLNGRPSPSNKYQNTTAPLENEARTIVMQKNLSVNSKLHAKGKGYEDYFKRALNIASMEKDRYRKEHGHNINRERNLSRQNNKATNQDTSQNRQMEQMFEVQNQIQEQMRQAMMMNSNNSNNNNNNSSSSNPVIPAMPFLHQLPYSLQSAQVNPFLAHLDNVNRNHGSNNDTTTTGRLQTEMHRWDIPSLSQAQPNSNVVHHSQLAHSYQPPVPFQLSPQPLSLPSYGQVGTSAGNDIGQVYGASTGGLDYYHNMHQQQQQEPHVHTTARGTVAGSSLSVYSMTSPQVVTTTRTPVAAVAYNGNNDNGRVYRGDNNNNDGGSGSGSGDDEVSGHSRLVGIGNNDYDDDDDNDEGEMFVDALDNRNNTENRQESQGGVISTMKAWVSSTFRRFGNY